MINTNLLPFDFNRKCVKIESEHDEWYCQMCENLNIQVSLY